MAVGLYMNDVHETKVDPCGISTGAGSSPQTEVQRLSDELRNCKAELESLKLQQLEHQKKSEDDVKRERSLLRCLIDSVGDLIFVKDINGVYLACNKASEEFIGLSESDQIGKTDFDFFDQEMAGKVWEQDRRVISSGKESRTEEWVTSRDGRRVLLHTLKAPFYGPDGEQLGLVGISRDISERKRVEEALSESEERFRTLCDSAPIGIFLSDSEGNNVYCNPRWDEITGMSAAEGLGMGWKKTVHPNDREESNKVWLDSVAAGRLYCHEHRLLTLQGETVWVRVLATPVKNPEGRILGHVGTVENITELSQARQELLKTQKLESLGVLAGGIAHDFNNILTAILGNISLARLQLSDPQKVLERLVSAENATVRAKELAQQLLTFARGGEPVKKIITVRGILREAADFALHGSSVRCEFAIEDGLWSVEADEGQLVQVIHNLVLNAVQAMPEGGTITITAANISSEHTGNRFVKISVADTGMGMSEQHLQRAFDPYFTTKQQGSGLGLATCYSIIRKHGGKIRAASKLGVGSRFIISLPASLEDSVLASDSPATVYRGNSSVLMMDDEDIILELSRAILGELGYTVECVENGKEAVELYQKRKDQGTPFSAVILDLTIPGGVGGREVIAELLKLDPDVKAIVSSGYSSDPVMANYRDYGFSAMLVKPYGAQEMSEVIGELLRNQCESKTSSEIG